MSFVRTGRWRTLRPTAQDWRFAEYLTDLATRGEGGALTALRRGLSTAPGGLPLVQRWLAPWTSGVSGAEGQRRLQVAMLFAGHPCPTDRGNMGLTCRALRQATGSRHVEQRFEALLASRAPDLPGRLRGLLGQARELAIPVNWAQLLVDLRYWQHPERLVQMAWADAFWTDGRLAASPRRLQGPT